MKANRLDGCPSTSFLTLLICLKCSDNNFGRSDIIRDISYGPEKAREFLMLIFQDSC